MRLAGSSSSSAWGRLARSSAGDSRVWYSITSFTLPIDPDGRIIDRLGACG
jgi:hypothetical protein